MEKAAAKEIHQHSLKAITELSKALSAATGQCSQQEYEKIKRTVGMSIGQIQTDILDPLNAIFAELDDLAKIS